MDKEKLFEEVLKEDGLEHLQEMAAVGEIRSSKVGHFYLEVFSREYEHETPHVTLEIPQSKNKYPVAKIEIPKEQPSLEDEPNFLWVQDDFTISKSLKKEIQKWFVEKDRRNLTGWDKSSMYWEDQSKAVSWGKLQNKNETVR